MQLLYGAWLRRSQRKAEARTQLGAAVDYLDPDPLPAAKSIRPPWRPVASRAALLATAGSRDLACAFTGWLMPNRCWQVKLPVLFRDFFLVDRLWQR